MDDVSPQINSALTGRSFTCLHDRSFPFRDITYLSGEQCIYHANMSTWKRNTPDIRLRRSHSDGQLVGHSYFRWNYSCPKVGIGSEETSMAWVDMPRKGALHPTQRFEWGGKTYVLHRLSSDECKALGIKWKLGSNLKVAEEGEGRLVARLLVESLAPKKAELSFAEGVGEELEVLIVLAVTTWRELARRKG